MMLLLLEHSQGRLTRTALQSISAGRLAAATNGVGAISALLLGAGEELAKAADEASGYGFSEVIAINNSQLINGLALATAAAITQVVADLKPTLILAPSSSVFKAAIPRVAARFDAGQASDVIAFPEKGIFRRPMFAGNIIAEVEVQSEMIFATIRTSSFDVADVQNTAAVVRQVELLAAEDSREQFISFDTVKSQRPELSSAEVVVAGGRALQSKENFEKYILPLADCLSAAVGASRAAVDSGYAPNDWQIGQTGKVVAPKLYLGVGISGAIQHLAGMKDSKVIVAINTDEEAPIFEIADYRLVADLYEVVPQLIEALQKSARC